MILTKITLMHCKHDYAHDAVHDAAELEVLGLHAQPVKLWQLAVLHAEILALEKCN